MLPTRPTGMQESAKEQLPSGRLSNHQFLFLDTKNVRKGQEEQRAWDWIKVSGCEERGAGLKELS